MTDPVRFLVRRLRPTLNRMGVDIVRYYPFEALFMKHIRRLGVTLTFDAGANMGQFGSDLRRSGYGGRIVSFEPVAEAFSKLSARAATDGHWTTLAYGLGRTEEEATINVGAGTWTSSIRPILEEVPLHYPPSAIDRTERIRLTTLNSVFSNYTTASDIVLFKMDVEGYEDEVLAGAGDVLGLISAIQIEMAVTPVHSGDRLMLDQIAYLQARGFRLIDISPGFRDGANQLLQVDGFFIRSDV